VRGKWRASFLSTFSDALHMRAGAEVDGISVEADQLGQAQAGLGRKQQQDMITTSEPCRAMWGGENRFDLGPRQEMHLAFVMTLAWYRQDSLDQGAVSRLLERYEPEEGANGCQAQVARLDAGASLRLEISEERADKRRIEIVEGQGRRRFAELRLCKRPRPPPRIETKLPAARSISWTVAPADYPI